MRGNHKQTTDYGWMKTYLPLSSIFGQKRPLIAEAIKYNLQLKTGGEFMIYA